MDLEKRVKQLMKQSVDAGNPFEKEQIDHRIARLTGGVAVLRVGAESEPRMLEKKARAEDAVHACRGAMEEGVVPGGGVALLRAVDAYDYKHLAADDRSKGERLLLLAIVQPAIQILGNAAHPKPSSVIEQIQTYGGSYGYDSATGKFGDLYEMGIVDPAKVVRVALLKAASIGALLLTTEVLCCDIPESKPAMQMPPMMRG